MALEPDQVLNNRYRIQRLLGQGGFGEVYQAWDMRLEGYCAVKRNLQPAPEVRRQFEQEAMMLFRLKHGSLPKVYDYFTGQEDEQYLVMEYIEGENLHSRLTRTGPPPVEQALTWIEQVCDALNYLHTRQPPVVHRDIKPANIIITSEGQAVLVDFGIAKADPQMRTLSGARAWSPGFAPPEQYGQGRTDAQSDIYSLGATAYALLTGETPPDAMDVAAGDKELALPIHIVNPAVPLQVSQAVEQAMQFNRALRTRSAAEFRQALKKQPRQQIHREDESTIVELRPQTPTAHRKMDWRWVAAGLVAAVVLFGVAWTAWKFWGAQVSRGIATIDPATWAARTRQAEENQQSTETVQNAMATTATAEAVKQANDSATAISGTSTSVAVAIQAATLAAVTDTPVVVSSTSPACTAVGQTWTSPVDGMNMVCVPAGEFKMGSEEGDDNEKPVHPVYLDAFWIDQTEVTNAMYAQFVAETGYQNAGSSDVGLRNHPVINVNWSDTDAYCQWAQRQLPSEAQWEKAARGTDERTYPWGDQEPNCELVNSYLDPIEEYCVGETSPVGSYPGGASPYGALDMAGNVREWAADFFHTFYYQDYPRNSWPANPQGPSFGSYRVVRGGSWGNKMDHLRSTRRLGASPDSFYTNTGFRCAVLPGE
jgi:eukaryotic-like serine/threonine-protein kinase